MSKYVDTVTFFSKTWTKGHGPPDDLWPQVCWGHMCDATQGSLCPSPMGIHQCMWIQWSILQNSTHIYIHTTYYVHTTYYIHTTYTMSDHIVSFWTKFRRDKNSKGVVIWASGLAQRLFPCLHQWGPGSISSRVRWVVCEFGSQSILAHAGFFSEYFGFLLHLKSYLLSILSNSFLIFPACALNILPVKL